MNKPSKMKIERDKQRKEEDSKLKAEQSRILSEVSKKKEDEDKKANAVRASAKIGGGKVEAPKKVQRLIRRVFVEERKKQGWKVIKDDARDNHKRTLGVKTFNELVLMEK